MVVLGRAMIDRPWAAPLPRRHPSQRGEDGTVRPARNNCCNLPENSRSFKIFFPFRPSGKKSCWGSSKAREMCLVWKEKDKQILRCDKLLFVQLIIPFEPTLQHVILWSLHVEGGGKKTTSRALCRNWISLISLQALVKQPEEKHCPKPG